MSSAGLKNFETWGDNLIYGIFILVPLLTGGLLIWLVRYSRNTRSFSKTRVVITVNVLLLLFFIFFGLALTETYYRFWMDTTDSFGVTRLTLRWFGRHWRLNQAGYRDSLAEYPVWRPPGQCRITFLGDSFTAGHGIADVEDRFANRIRATGSCEVHVPADLGYDTRQHLEIVQGLITQRYEFDQVVLAYNLNDIGDLSPRCTEVIKRICAAPPPGFFIRHSFFLDTCYYRIKGHFDPDVSNYGQSMLQCYEGPLWESQQGRLKTLRDLVESRHGRLLVLTFPFLHHLGPRYEFRAVHAKLGRFWQDLKVPHLDLLEVFEAHRDQDLTVNSHDAHPNVLAHRLAADAIKDFLDKNATPETRR